MFETTSKESNDETSGVTSSGKSAKEIKKLF